MSWPKLNDRRKTLLILTQASRGSRRWRKPQKKRKRIEGGGLASKTFQFLEDSGPYSVVKDVGSQKVNITIG
jgi:hypothetical protein